MFPILFADDTNSLACGNNLPELVNTVNEELVKITDWLAANKLSLNIKKTHFMLFKTKGKKFSSDISIKIRDQCIDKVTHTKFLGITIDDRLNWSNHITCIKNKIAKGLGIMRKAKSLLKEKTLITLYYSFIYPYLHYGIIAWGKTTNNYLNPLSILQKRAIRLISSAHKFDHTAPLFKKLGLLKLENIYNQCHDLHV